MYTPGHTRFPVSLLLLMRVILIVLFLALSGVSGAAGPGTDPVVIEVGDRSWTRSQFEHRFQLAMVLNALRAGAPIKSGVQLRELREQYLDQRVSEILLLDEAQSLSLSVTEAELDTEMEVMLSSMYPAGARDIPVDPAGMHELREFLRDQLLLGKLRQHWMASGDAADRGSFDAYLQQIRGRSQVVLWPDRLD